MARFLFGEELSFQIRKKEIPKRMYRDVHTGPNTQLGGLNEGLFNDAYQVGTACEVNIPATAPTDKGIIKETISLKMFDPDIFAIPI